MDEPPPPEYESPMTPMTPLDGSGTELQEPYTPYTPYSNQPATPLHTGCVRDSFPYFPFLVLAYFYYFIKKDKLKSMHPSVST
jgi:hypothetical protein